jgi:tetratricopeptide (TPR) repeat protein
MVTSDWESARHHIKAGLRLVDAKGAEDAGAMRLWLNDAMARTAYRQRDAERLAGIAGGLEHLSGDLEGADLVDCRAAARLWLGCSHLLEGDQEESRRAFEAVASVEGSSFQGLAWHFLSEVAQSHRKLDLAQTSLAKALAFFKDRTWHSGYQRKLFRLAEADVKRNMGHFFASLNQADEQRRYIEEALETFVQEGDMQGEARALAELIRMLRLRLEAQALPDTELLAEAQRVWNKLDHIMSLLDDRRGHALKDWEAASLAMVDGELDLAETFYKRAGEHFLACGDKLGHGLALNAQAEMSRRRGHLSDAHALTERFVSLMEDIPNDHIRALALNNLGWIEIEIGHLEMAPQRFERALSLVGESGPALDRASMLVGSAELLVIGGDLEEALPTLAAARATCPDAPVLDTAIGDSLNRIATSLASNGQGAATSICALVGGWLAAAPAS